MSKMLFCVECRVVWAYDHNQEEHTVKNQLCGECEAEKYN